MELSDANVIKALVEGSMLPPRIAANLPRIPRRAMAKRCLCGRCASCVDNARWERIFQEKFADPTYYSRQTVQRSSSLHGID
jgi:hypothetical protein